MTQSKQKNLEGLQVAKSKLSLKEVKELVAAGFTVQQIAKQRGLSASRVYQILYQMDKLPPKNPRPHVKPPSLPPGLTEAEFPPDSVPYSVGPADMLLQRLRQFHTLKDVVNCS